ncbi:MAG: FtsX-like permease family protein [Phycisphaerae bacterium]|nr:FtsX-like permease family protein [Phycisphaerae bacterium]
MTVWRLIGREIAHRRVNAILTLVSVAAAVGCLAASLMLLRGHDLQTQRVVSTLEAQTQDRVDQLVDDYRKIALQLGFNVFILPRGVSPQQVHEASLGGHEMPEQYVQTLAEAGILTIDHLLPSLSASVQWTEQKLSVILTGVRGEVAVAGKKRKRPLIQPVDPGQIVLGYKVAEQTGLKVDREVEFLGQRLTVRRVHNARGTKDDNTVWIDLALAQKLLGREGRITAIQAINCLAPNCHPDATGIPSVNEEIARVLPETQVIIDMGKARARIDSRQRAAEEAKAALAHEKDRRQAIRAQLDRFAAILNPLVMVGAGIWVGLLALVNVRERRSEIGILRAFGVRSSSVLLVFLGKALLLGLLGAAVGCAAGVAVATWLSEPGMAELLNSRLLIGALVGAPILAAVASWIPAMLAAQQDPAGILCRE